MQQQPSGLGLSVLYLIDSLARGGAEQSLVEMAPHICSRGVKLSVAVLFDRAGLQSELERIGVPVQVVAGDGRIARITRMSMLLRSIRPDLLHTTLFESDLVGRTAGWITRTPVVSTLATTPYGPEHASEAGIHRMRLGAAQVFDSLTARTARRLHAVSDPVAEACIARLHLDRSKVEVIPRGRDLGRLGVPSAGRRQAVRSSLDIAGNIRVLLFAGRHEPAKGLEVLINAIPSVKSAVPEVMLLVAGREGRTTESVHRLVREHRLEDTVRFLGERSDIGDLLCAADLLVLPSLREGLPGVLLEAMAMKVPIVASDIQAVREAIPDRSFGFLVSPRDPEALAKVLLIALLDRSQCQAKVVAARERFDHRFDMKVVADAMVRFYRRSLSGTRS